MKNLILGLLIVNGLCVLAQGNCEVYKFSGDSTRYKACLKCEEAKFYQFDIRYQSIMDEAIILDSTYAYPFKAKSTAYLKSGDFIRWKYYIDKAVELDPKSNLGYRASCRYQFFRDYDGCIADIEKLDSLIDGDIGEIHNGDYHLKMLLAISYDAIGDTEKALALMNEHMNQANYYALIYDYVLRGFIHNKLQNYELAIDDFKRQEEIGDLAENQFYLSKAYNALGMEAECIVSLKKAKELYQSEIRMNDPYTEPYAKIYLQDIQMELEKH